jgi:hypothetical protein
MANMVSDIGLACLASHSACNHSLTTTALSPTRLVPLGHEHLKLTHFACVSRWVRATILVTFSRTAAISFRFWLSRDDQPPPRAVEVRAGHRISAFDVAQRDVAGVTQQPSDALSARSILPLAAGVVMVYVDELTLLERLVAHRAGVVLCRQNQVELFLSESIARNPVLPVGFLAGIS